ncbi:RNA polymerase II holoenzyme cyclin-like subunit [Myotisia sp. PD_48]|nr:RNA polymerase II holoenzyme cyclin-like subunit [Myotisia sp. PD_48]
MAANYWTSTQRRFWLFNKEQLSQIRRSLEDPDRSFIQQYPLPDPRLINIYLNQQLLKLAKRISTRQQALATAQVYLKRFYTKVEIRQTNPYLVLTTAFYLACKTEECPQHIKYVVGEARCLWPEFVQDSSKVGECEFWLISELNSQLIVYHPYRVLSESHAKDQAEGQAQSSTFLGLSGDELALAWSIINDHYLTDTHLLHPPHVIAVMAVFVAVIFKPANNPGGGSNSSSSTTISNSVGGTGGTGGTASAGGTMASAVREGGGMKMLAAVGGGEASKAGEGMPLRVKRVVDWLARSEVDITGVIDSTQDMISLYEVWEQYSEKTCREMLGKYVKARNLDK